MKAAVYDNTGLPGVAVHTQKSRTENTFKNISVKLKAGSRQRPCQRATFRAAAAVCGPPNG
ncbi:hypothetical protein E2C01_061421 [Portunus trituberculatus]|uniref:Uncharacterized protein n=1 Tax=Portunus trituberculatus TaxID=210409 RepID=A0A5B7HEB7_PORTR|nr:hypothetical protein [Portunus trituberculatus]